MNFHHNQKLKKKINRKRRDIQCSIKKNKNWVNILKECNNYNKIHNIKTKMLMKYNKKKYIYDNI